MAVRKPCRSKGCKTSPRCEHPWWLDVMHKHVRYRMSVDEFAFARGATAPVTSEQEAEKVWEPRFIAEIASGNDPRVPRERESVPDGPATIADLLKLYRARYVEVEPLKSRSGILSQLSVLCRRAEMMKIQNKHVDWRHCWIRILKEHSKGEVAHVIPFEPGSRLEKLLRRRGFLGPEAYVFGDATTGAYVKGVRSAWETVLLLANGIEPTRLGGRRRVSNRETLARIDLRWHDLRHEALSRLADDGVPVHELQLLAGHASITTTQRYMNARANSLAESMREARERRAARMEDANRETVQVG